MKTLEDKEKPQTKIDIFGVPFIISYGFKIKDIKEHLNNFYNAYWKESKIGDKHKNYISCDELDYLLNKHFGNIIEIKTLQKLEK